MVRLEFILLFVALVAFTYNYAHQRPVALSFDIKNPLAPEEATLVAGAKTDLGPLKLGYTASWGRSLSSKLSFDLDIKPPEPRWVDISFTTDSLDNIRVREGQAIEQGDLLGIKSKETQRQIEELQAKLAQGEDLYELIRAELEGRIQELRRQNEVHALISGYIRSLWVEQVEEELTVHLRVVLGGGEGENLESP